jgi:hypothetical protein
MTIQTFNPSDLSQSAANWTVAQRVVSNFAPHAQPIPNMTLALDTGHLLNGSILTEVNVQSVGPFSLPLSGFRVDRVVVNRTTGVASIVAGAANSSTPPAIPVGTLPVARVMLQPTTGMITNDLIVDERAVADMSVPQFGKVACRATLGGVNQTGVANDADVKILFNAVDYNIGGGFDVQNIRFRPTVPGCYAVTVQVYSIAYADKMLRSMIFKNGSLCSLGSFASPIQLYFTATVSDVIYLNGTTDYLEGYALQANGGDSILLGNTYGTYFAAHLVA